MAVGLATDGGVGLGVGVGVAVGRGLTPGAMVGVDVAVGPAVAVATGVRVGVAVGAAAAADVGVGAGVGVRVGVGSGPAQAVSSPTPMSTMVSQRIRMRRIVATAARPNYLHLIQVDALLRLSSQLVNDLKSISKGPAIKGWTVVVMKIGRGARIRTGGLFEV